MGIEVRICRQIPFQHISDTVAVRDYNKVLDMPPQIRIKFTLAGSLLFGEVDILVRMGFMHFRQRLDFADVKMEC